MATGIERHDDPDKAIKHIFEFIERTFEIMTHHSISSVDRHFVMRELVDAYSNSIYIFGGNYSDITTGPVNYWMEKDRFGRVLMEAIKTALWEDEYLADRGIEELEEHFDFCVSNDIDLDKALNDKKEERGI